MRPNSPLWRFTTAVYWFIVVEICFLLAAAPGFAGLLLLERDASNIPLFAACLVPVAPAFTAAMATLDRRAGAEDMVVFPLYWRLWWGNLADVLKLWIPAAVVLAVLGINAVIGPEAGVSDFLVVGSVVLGALLLLWAVNAVVIATFFKFRTRDVARLGVFYLFAKPKVTLGVVSFVVVVTGIIALTSDWVAALAGSLLAALLLFIVGPLRDDVRDRFTTDEASDNH